MPGTRTGHNESRIEAAGISRHSFASSPDLRLIAQDHVQEGPVDFNSAVIVDKAQLPKSVHKKTDARSRRADHLRQGLLADFCNYRLRRSFLAEIRQQQKNPRQAFLARIEQLIDQVLLDPTVAGQQVRDEQLGKSRLFGDEARDSPIAY